MNDSQYYKNDIIIYNDPERKVIAMQYCKCVNIYGITVMAEELKLDPYANPDPHEYDKFMNIKKASNRPEFKDVCYYDYYETQTIKKYLKGWHVPTLDEAKCIAKYINSGATRLDPHFLGYIIAPKFDYRKYLDASGDIFFKLWIDAEPKGTSAYAIHMTKDEEAEVRCSFVMDSKLPLRLIRDNTLV